uniref:Uncharacterized protein n=1 Tax=Arundo donax TaxID=35708 RepID=A0A0A8YLF9_ARUDO
MQAPRGYLCNGSYLDHFYLHQFSDLHLSIFGSHICVCS